MKKQIFFTDPEDETSGDGDGGKGGDPDSGTTDDPKPDQTV